jgi:hypothetical protein
MLLRERLEYAVYRTLLSMIPGLEARLVNSSDEETRMIADLVSDRLLIDRCHCANKELCLKLQKGASSARSDDTKGLKSAVLDWIVPRGESLTPPIPRNVKTTRGFNHDKTGALLCPVEFDWSDEEWVSSPHVAQLIVTLPIRVKAKLCSGDITVPGDQWPILLYKECKYDPEDPWSGLLRSAILVSVREP